MNVEMEFHSWRKVCLFGFYDRYEPARLKSTIARVIKGTGFGLDTVWASQLCLLLNLRHWVNY